MPLSSTIYVLAIPFFMFLFLGLVGVKMPRKVTGVIGVLAMAVTIISMVLVKARWLMVCVSKSSLPTGRGSRSMPTNWWFASVSCSTQSRQ